MAAGGRRRDNFIFRHRTLISTGRCRPQIVKLMMDLIRFMANELPPDAAQAHAYRGNGDAHDGELADAASSASRRGPGI